MNLQISGLDTQHYHCIICKKDMSDMYDHMDINYTDKQHEDYEDKVSESGYKLPCFCGGAIMWAGTGSDGGEARCIHCDLIWTEL